MSARLLAITLGLGGCGFSPTRSTALPNDGDSMLDGSASIAYCDATDPTLVGCYRFEDNLTDDSSHHNSGTAAVSYGGGRVGQALVVGLTSGVDIPDSPSFDVADLTIEAWISPSVIPTIGNRAGILDCEGQYGFFLHPNGDLICTAGGSVTAQANVQPNRWTHVVCTHMNGTISICVDGTLVTSGVGGVLPTANTSGITLGGNNPPGGGSPLNGMLDQVRLFGVGLTPIQVCIDAGKTAC